MARRYHPPTNVLSRYVRVPGSAEKRRNIDTGKIITRRQYDDIRAKDAGWQNSREYQETAKRLGNQLHGIDSERSLQYLYFYKYAYESPDWSLSTYENLYSAYLNDSGNMRPNGPLSKLLEWIGLREPGATYNVGDTPKA